jgi:hypothetical protein
VPHGSNLGMEDRLEVFRCLPKSHQASTRGVVGGGGVTGSSATTSVGGVQGAKK